MTVDIPTIIVSGLIAAGSAWFTNWYQAKQKRREVAADRAKTLRAYERELWDFVSYLENDMLGGYSDTSFIDGLPASASAARADAYHYFHEFSTEERSVLAYPVGSEDLPHDSVDRCAKAAQAIEQNLAQKRWGFRRPKVTAKAR